MLSNVRPSERVVIHSRGEQFVRLTLESHSPDNGESQRPPSDRRNLRHFLIPVPVTTVAAVQGSSVDLPCNISAPIRGDRVKLVLWFKNESSLPIYTYDVRGKAQFEEARHWSDDATLGGRAFFRGDQLPARLVLDNVRNDDAAVYKCRVDFRKAPTRISNVVLDVIGEKY